MARLDIQRQPHRAHFRKNGRFYIRGYDTTPHAPWGDTAAADVAKAASTATVGTPTPTTFTRSTTPASISIAGTGFVPGTYAVVRLKGPPAGSWQPIPDSTFVGSTQITSTKFDVSVAGAYEVAVVKPGEKVSGATTVTVT